MRPGRIAALTAAVVLAVLAALTGLVAAGGGASAVTPDHVHHVRGVDRADGQSVLAVSHQISVSGHRIRIRHVGTDPGCQLHIGDVRVAGFRSHDRWIRLAGVSAYLACTLAVPDMSLQVTLWKA